MRKVIVYSIIFIAILGVFAYSGFLIQKTNLAYAQGQSQAYVYLNEPDTSDPNNPPVLFGEYEFILEIIGIPGSEISEIDIEVVSANGSHSYGFMHIEDFWNEDPEDYRWHVVADTLPFINGFFGVHIHAYNQVGIPFELVRSASRDDPVFGPIQFDNKFNILSPEANQYYTDDSLDLIAAISGGGKNGSIPNYAG